MKEKLKKIGYWFENKLKDLCGELTPDKRITVISIMLLVLTIEIEHIKQLELERRKDSTYDFFDSEIEQEHFDQHKPKSRKDSIDSLSINKQQFKEYERTIRNEYGAKTKT